MPRRVAILGLQGSLLRYAEIEMGEAMSLRRLGTVEFDGDVERTLLGDGGPPLGPALERAVREVFAIDASGAPEALIVAAHPSHTVSFATPLPESLGAAATHEQLRQEAALLADVPAGRPVRIRAVPVRSEPLARIADATPEPHQWHHVLYLSEAVHARLSLLARALGVGSYDLVDTTRAAAAIVQRLDPSGDVDRVTLAVGAYAGHTEYALCRGGAWAYGHHGPGAAPEDTAYYALALLERLGLEADAPRRLFVYGDDTSEGRLGLLTQMLDLPAELLDPLVLFNRRPPEAGQAQLSGFAPLLGVGLD
ncbi:hypothetical protein [Rubricoccus marinus]|uniref:Uncharacterized protein n=1 Tax=Rubricoccus marinus TaxID=716817 RepID=A0A259TYM9_9BACT|nr:hypothetical protein [Rubricoccus marinus]OZC02873.1 hypothetical protein BSZ36_07750 [Rubricoccus marinus]